MESGADFFMALRSRALIIFQFRFVPSPAAQMHALKAWEKSLKMSYKP